MIFLLFQTGEETFAYADLQWTLISVPLAYTIGADNFDFTLVTAKLDFTVTE